MSTNSAYSEVLRRHALPEVLFHPDTAFALGISEDEADDAMRAARLGIPFYVGGRVAVRREDFLEALALIGEGRGSKDVLGQRLRAVPEQEAVREPR